ncbi:MAG: hypothetical protein J6F31_07730 [Oscillospiraceae bacterium]|nr:hypothetical protein [Oscillospiraceae bacterium]
MDGKKKIFVIAAALCFALAILFGALAFTGAAAYLNGTDRDAVVTEVRTYTKSPSKRTYNVSYEAYGMDIESSFTLQDKSVSYGVGDIVRVRTDDNFPEKILSWRRITAFIFFSCIFAVSGVLSIIDTIRKGKRK